MNASARIAVYELRPNVNGFQYLVYDGDDSEFRAWSHHIDALYRVEPMCDRWEPPPMYSPEPRLQRPDIWDTSSGAVALSERAVEALSPRLWSVELLPLHLEHETLHVMHVMQVIECLDREHSELAPTGAVERYSFVPHRVPESPLFRIPDDIAMLTPEFTEVAPSLRRLVQLHDLQGFEFAELWNDAEGPKPLHHRAF